VLLTVAPPRVSAGPARKADKGWRLTQLDRRLFLIHFASFFSAGSFLLEQSMAAQYLDALRRPDWAVCASADNCSSAGQ